MASAVRQAISHSSGSTLNIKWTLTDADPIGDWVELPVGMDRSIHVIFQAGSGTITIQGTNEPVAAPSNPRTLAGYAEDGNSLSGLTFSSGGLRQVLTMSLKIRPQLTGASGATIAVYLMTKGGD